MKVYLSYEALTDEIMLAIRDRVAGSTTDIVPGSIGRYVEVDSFMGMASVLISDQEAPDGLDKDVIAHIDIQEFCIDEVFDDYGDLDRIEVNHEWKIAEAIEIAVDALEGAKDA